MRPWTGSPSTSRDHARPGPARAARAPGRGGGGPRSAARGSGADPPRDARGGGLEALFIRRAQRADDPWSGQVALPGGRRDAGDADLFATAVRETREETGIDLAGAERLGRLDDLYPRTPTLPPVVVRPFVFALVA